MPEVTGGWNAFMYACARGSVRCAHMLLMHGATPGIRDSQGFLGRDIARTIIPQRTEFLKQLDGWGMLDATQAGHVEAIERFLDLGVIDANFVADQFTENGSVRKTTCLRVVSCHDIAGIWVAFFQERQRCRCGQAVSGLQVENLRADGRSAQMVADGVTSVVPMVRLLLERKADPNIPDGAGFMPLMGAVQAEPCNLEVITMLLEAQADPNRDHPQSGYTPLMLSCILDRPDVAETLVRARVDPSVRNK